MKKIVCWALMALITGSILGTSVDAHPVPPARDIEGTKEDMPPSKKRNTAKPRPLPFHGTIKEIDAKAQTIQVGKRLFHLNDQTKLMRNGESIKLEDVLPGQRVGGSYLKDEKGNLHALKLNFKVTSRKEQADGKETR